MDCYEEWYAQWVQRSGRASSREYMVSIEGLREQWVGRQVWYAAAPFAGYAWVESIDERGRSTLLFEQELSGYPDRRLRVPMQSLGVTITHAN